MALPAWLADDERIVHVHHRPARPGRTSEWPDWLPEQARAAFAARGIARPWAHQVEAAQAAHDGHHVALATGTASGKSLAFLMPVLAAALAPPPGAAARSGSATRPTRPAAPPPSANVAGVGLRMVGAPTALYLAPTKALAHDQLRACEDLDLAGWRPAALDGDSDADERRFAREFASYVLTNPDMLHRSVLPQHTRHARLLGGLTHVVVDEAHRYKGVFGAHVSAVLRRLRRLAHHYGADPVFVFASATISEPDAVARALSGAADVHAVTADASPAPALDVALLEPTASLTETTARLLAGFTASGQALAFTTSRVQAELVALRARELSDHPEAIAAYRGGYLAEDRRALESALSEGRLRGVAATNALELGIDIAGMDAVVTAGFPGTMAAFWQQVGRAGRAGRDAVAVLAAREDPLDAWLVQHPEALFDRPVERTVVPVDNPWVLGPHLCAAAQELPLTADDARWFGPETVALAERLTAQGALRRRARGWFWTHPVRAVDSIDLRSMQGKAVEVVDSATGRVIGQVDPGAADRTLHPEAIYVHQGETWFVDELDLGGRVALVHREDPAWFTQPQSVAGVRILAISEERPFGAGTLSRGSVELSGQVVGYLRRDAETGDVWDSTPLDLPEHTMVTRAVWWTLPDAVLVDANLADLDLAGAVHGAEHCAIGLLPAFVPSDRWDIGGLSTVLHPDTGALTVFVHDGLPGGSGIADRGFEVARAWWEATAERLRACPCEDGCPACVVSPKCGSGNNPLDKRGAAALVALLLGHHA